jgi:hypothetical protein
LFTVVEISTKGYIKIVGKQPQWGGLSPWGLGYPLRFKAYVKSAIPARYLLVDY